MITISLGADYLGGVLPIPDPELPNSGQLQVFLPMSMAAAERPAQLAPGERNIIPLHWKVSTDSIEGGALPLLLPVQLPFQSSIGYISHAFLIEKGAVKLIVQNIGRDFIPLHAKQHICNAVFVFPQSLLSVVYSE